MLVQIQQLHEISKIFDSDRIFWTEVLTKCSHSGTKYPALPRQAFCLSNPLRAFAFAGQRRPRLRACKPSGPSSAIQGARTGTRRELIAALHSLPGRKSDRRASVGAQACSLALVAFSSGCLFFIFR